MPQLDRNELGLLIALVAAILSIGVCLPFLVWGKGDFAHNGVFVVILVFSGFQVGRMTERMLGRTWWG